MHIFDRFHVMKILNEKIDRIRADEVRRLKATRLCDLLKHGGWCLFENSANLSERRAIKLSELVKQNRPCVRA